MFIIHVCPPLLLYEVFILIVSFFSLSLLFNRHVLHYIIHTLSQMCNMYVSYPVGRITGSGTRLCLLELANRHRQPKDIALKLNAYIYR